MILDASTKLADGRRSALREAGPDWGDSLGHELRPARWEYVPPALVPRQPGDVMVEAWLREALIRLNPDIAAQPDRSDTTESPPPLATRTPRRPGRRPIGHRETPPPIG
jgi:hypothetical protein